MIQFTRSLPSIVAGAMLTASLVSCAGGAEAEPAQDDVLDTTSEVVSAEFPGGAAEVMSFIAGEVTYPESARADGVEGKVFVEFTIAENGAVTHAHVIASWHPALDSAAVAAAVAMPNWTPATKEGEAIATTITLPVMFRL